MSNYIFGYIKGAENPLSFYADAIRARSVLGFHDVAAPHRESQSLWPLPIKSYGLPIPEGCPMTFCVSDTEETLLSEWLMLESDFDPAAHAVLPYKLRDRIALIVDQVRLVFEITQASEVGLWLSQVDELEGITDVSLPQFMERLEADFETRGVPCLLYKITAPSLDHIPERERWIYQNPEVLSLLQAGLAEAAAGLVTEGEDFSRYADLDIDDQ